MNYLAQPWLVIMGGSFVTIYSNYDMSQMLIRDVDENKMYLLSKEPFDLEESLSYFGQYDSFFFDEVVR